MKISDYTLELYHLGELSALERAAVDAEMTSTDRQRLADLATSDAAILALYPARVVAIDVERKRKAGRRRVVAPLLGGLSLVGAAAAVFLVVGQVPQVEAPNELLRAQHGTRTKSQPGLTIKRRSADGDAVILRPNAQISEGDVLQLALNPGLDDHAVALSIDGRGAVTLHFPHNSMTAGAIDPGRNNVLGDAYRLDDAPDFERFFLVTHSGEFGVRQVLSAAKTLAEEPGTARDGELQLPDDLHVYEHTLIKVNP